MYSATDGTAGRPRRWRRWAGGALLTVALAWSLAGGLRSVADDAVEVDERARSGSGPIRPGETAPGFRAPALNGGWLRLADTGGRPLVLNFFASWCDPCREEAPVVRDLVQSARQQGVAVLGVAIRDEREDAARFMQEHGLDFPVVLDADARIARAYGVVGPPTAVFIDGGGTVRHVVMGPLTPASVATGWERSGAPLPAAGADPPGPAAAGAGGAAGSTGSLDAFATADGFGTVGSTGSVGTTGAVGVLLALGLGFLSFLSPCVLPLVPAYLGYVTGLAGADGTDGTDGTNGPGAGSARLHRLLVRSGAFALGLVLAFTAMGLSATALGGWLADQRPWLTRAAGLLVLAFGLHMLDLLPLPVLQREFRPGLQRLAGHRPGAVGGATGALALGAAFAIGWTPCVGPMLGSILLVASQETALGRGALLLAAYGIGFGLPFVLAGLAAGRLTGLLARARRGLAVATAVGGALLVSVGLLMVADRLDRLSQWLGRLFS